MDMAYVRRGVVMPSFQSNWFILVQYSNLFNIGEIDPKIISDSLGHSSVSFTLDTYGHLFPSQKAQAADVFDVFLKTG